MQHNDPIIVEYTDRQAVEDGVLVPVPGDGGVNRVTRAVFDHFTAPIGRGLEGTAVTDVTMLLQAIRELVKLEPDADGWRTGTFNGKTLWLVPNEVSGLTLLFPEDY